MGVPFFVYFFEMVLNFCTLHLQDELLNELEELEQEELDAKMLESAPPAMRAPNVPSHEPGTCSIVFPQCVSNNI
jgi:hypothetical protein